LKLTIVVCAVLFLTCAAYCQEPLNHAVTQPVARQVVESQTVVVQSGVGEHVVIQPFVFQPMTNIPHQRAQATVIEPTPVQPQTRVTASPAEPSVHQPVAHQPATCGCGTKSF
jgi:hypothetical protein